ncbi:MAG TPA: asparagine synthase C-terminal domain-containing protein, partial [Thermoleophilia bacterium]|nr:asparagine synthase C-terminal domain-containing protein [Thermoleophilia bacterium]
LRAPGVTETPSDPTGELEHLLQTAVDDRLRDTDSAGISMSGGIDSPLIAAMARGRHGGSRPVELLAETVVFDHLIPDDERRFAAIAANALDIPITFRPADEDYDRLVERLQAPSRLPEPPADPTAPVNEMLPSFATHTRVVLTGYDGDALCQIWLPSHFRRLIGRGRIGQAIQQIRELSRLTGSFPPKGATGFWSPYLLRQARRRAAAEFPQWIDAELVNGLDLVERWQQAQARGRPWSRAPEADAIELLTEGGARDVFENFDPAITGTGVAVRHPLFDLRVIEYMLALPPIPWKVEKTVLRRAASRSLPATLWQRPKSPLAADPLEIWISNATLQEREFQPSRAEAYVNSALLPTLSSASASGTLWPRLWATGLDRWLLGQGREA